MGWIGLRRKTDNDDGSGSNGGEEKAWHIYNLQFSAFTKCANKHVRSVLQHTIEKLSCKCISTESNGLRRISNISLVFLMYSIHIDIFTKLFQKTFLTHLRIVPRRFWRFVDFNVLCHLIVLTDRFWKLRERACIHISDGMYANNGDVHIRCVYTENPWKLVTICQMSWNLILVNLRYVVATSFDDNSPVKNANRNTTLYLTLSLRVCVMVVNFHLDSTCLVATKRIAINTVTVISTLMPMIVCVSVCACVSVWGNRIQFMFMLWLRTMCKIKNYNHHASKHGKPFICCCKFKFIQTFRSLVNYLDAFPHL